MEDRFRKGFDGPLARIEMLLMQLRILWCVWSPMSFRGIGVAVGRR